MRSNYPNILAAHSIDEVTWASLLVRVKGERKIRRFAKAEKLVTL